MIPTLNTNEIFETECRRTLKITGKEFLRRMVDDDFADFDPTAVQAVKQLLQGDVDGSPASHE